MAMRITIVSAVPFAGKTIERILLDGDGPYWQVRLPDGTLANAERVDGIPEVPACFISFASAQRYALETI